MVELFDVYMFYCFLETAHANRYIKSYDDRMDLLLSMIDLEYGMYYKFIELLRGKPFEALSGKWFENKDNDTLDLDEKIIAKWLQRLKELYPALIKPLESSAEVAICIVK